MISTSATLRVVGDFQTCRIPRSKEKGRKSRQVAAVLDTVLSQVRDNTSLVRRRLRETYNVLTVTARRTSAPHEVDLTFQCHGNKEGNKLLGDCKNGELGRVLQDTATGKYQDGFQINLTVSDGDAESFLEACSKLRVSRSTSEDVLNGASVFPEAHSISAPERCGTYEQNAGLNEGRPLTPPTTNSSLSVVNKVITEQLKSKEYTEYDLHCLLKKHSNCIVPLFMLDDNGLNMLHQCVQHNRVAFLKVFHAHGYWADLIEQEVPRSSVSEFAGCTPRQMAERKRMRRFMKEIDRLSQQEKSMNGRNAGLRASRSGNLSLLKTMVASGNVDMKAKDSEGYSCVHWAAFSGNLNLIIYLTQDLRVGPDLRNENGETPLDVAVMYGQSSLIPYLAKKFKLSAQTSDKSGKTPQKRTAENGDINTLSALLKCTAIIDQSLGLTAAQFGRQAYLEHIFLSYNLDPMYKNPDGKTCLMVAAESGHLKIVKFLLEHFDIPLSDVNNQRRSVFHYVADKGHADVAKFLMEKARVAGELPDLLNEKDTHRVEQLCSLVRGVDKGRSAWHYVHLKRKYVSLFQKLTKGGRIDASQVGTILQSGWGPEPDAEVLKRSVDRYRTNESTKDGKDDFSPTLLSIGKGHSEVAKLFIEAGGDVKAKDCFGQTAMHLAAMRGNLDVAVELELRGLGLDTKDEEGDIPLDIAEANEHPELVNFFKGQEHIGEVQKFVEKLEDIQRKQSQEFLKSMRRSGVDVTRHVVDTVRDLQININVLLMKIGSGPVVEESRSEFQESASVGTS